MLESYSIRYLARRHVSIGSIEAPERQRKFAAEIISSAVALAYSGASGRL